MLFERQFQQQREVLDHDGQHGKQPGKAHGDHKHGGSPARHRVACGEDDQRIHQFRQCQCQHKQGNAHAGLEPGIGVQCQAVDGQVEAVGRTDPHPAVKFQVGHF